MVSVKVRTHPTELEIDFQYETLNPKKVENPVIDDWGDAKVSAVYTSDKSSLIKINVKLLDEQKNKMSFSYGVVD